MLLSSNWLIWIIVLPVAFIGLLYKYSTRNFGYWKKRCVIGPKPLPFLGNIWDVIILRASISDLLRNLYQSFDQPYVELYIFDKPCLFIKSPEIAKNILVKDFSYFRDRTIATPKHDPIFSSTLFAQKTPQWQEERSKLRPVFSPAKMKSMFPLVKNIGNNLVLLLRHHPGKYETIDICNNYTTDVIAKCFFGVDAGTIENGNGHFADAGKAMFEANLRNAMNQAIYFFKTELVDLLTPRNMLRIE